MNKKYFKYLVSNYKALFAFIALIEFLLVFINTITIYNADSAVYKVWIVSIVACFVLPILLFYHTLNKKAVDSYFALPLKRSEMAITSIVTMFLVIVIPAVLILSIVFTIEHVWSFECLMLIITMLITIISTLVFNSGIYLIANNAGDGVVMIGAYHFLPLLISFLENAINHVVYYGFTKSILFSEYMSNIAVSYEMMANLTRGIFKRSYSVSYLSFFIVSIAFILIGLFAIKNNYINRKTERADTISDRLTSYPFIIVIFATVLIISVSLGNYYYTSSYMSVLEDNLLFYILIIIAFIIATFIYKRKITINIKSIVYLVVVIASSIFMLQFIYSNEGFNKSYEYDREPNNIFVYVSRYSYYAYEDPIKDPSFKEGYDIYGTIEIAKGDPNYNEVINYINNIRDNNIREHFQHKQVYNPSGLGITSNFTRNIEYDYIENGDYYNYSNVNLTNDDFDFLSKYGDFTVSVFDEKESTVIEYSYQEFKELTKE